MPLQTPRTWHGMTAGIWFSLLSRNDFAISPSRMPMAAAISCFSVANSVLRLLSEALYARKAAAVTIENPPLFVDWPLADGNDLAARIAGQRRAAGVSHDLPVHGAAPFFAYRWHIQRPGPESVPAAQPADGRDARGHGPSAGRRVRADEPGRGIAVSRMGLSESRPAARRLPHAATPLARPSGRPGRTSSTGSSAA